VHIEEVPIGLLDSASNREFLSMLSDERSYYGIFSRLISGDNRFREEYYSLIRNDKTCHRAIKERALTKMLIDELGIPYSAASEMAGILKDRVEDIPIDLAIETTIENYMQIFAGKKSVPEIMTRINADGRFVIIEGHHRAAIYVAQGRKYLRCVVTDISQNWLDFVSKVEFQSLMLYKNQDSIYQHIDHPSFAKKVVIRENRKASLKRLSLNQNIKSVIDFGAFYGEISLFFSDYGKVVTAIEYDKEFADVIRQLSKTFKRSVDVLNMPIDEFLQSNHKEYDLGIALSIAYHLKRRDPVSYEKFIQSIKTFCHSIVIDSENRTGILSDEVLLSSFSEWKSTQLFAGSDSRNIFLFERM
jgi:hypothetical protein